MLARLGFILIPLCGLVAVGVSQGKPAQPQQPLPTLLEAMRVTLEDLGSFSYVSGPPYGDPKGDPRTQVVTRVREINKARLVIYWRSHQFGKPLEQGVGFVYTVNWANVKAVKVTKSFIDETFTCELTFRKPTPRRMEIFPPPADRDQLLEEANASWTRVHFAKRDDANLFRDQLLVLLKRLGLKLDPQKKAIGP